MKPVNLNTAPCSPVSSNCVIWQGPNIPCINLCNGDTISDVVFALATELCGILDTLDVANYDLSCFGITACGPNDFQALIQFLIAQICALQDVVPGEIKNTTDCPDCLVTVADCFVVGNQTTMNLTDYVNMIAAKICSIIDQLAIINATLTSLDIRVTTLENEPDPTFTIPSYIIGCDIDTLNAGTEYQIDEILEAFTNEVWCPFYTATGTTTEILAAIAAECILGTDPSRANPGVDMEIAYPSWNPTSNTLASTINHIWIALCDLYNASITVADTSTIDLTYTGGLLTARIIDTGWINLEGFTFYDMAKTGSAAFRPQCRRIGNVVHFRGLLTVPLASTLGGAALTYGYQSSPGYDSYFAAPYAYTAATGVGSCVIGTGGFITFNQGNSVIPAGILSVGETLDKTYGLGWKIAVRPIDVGATSTMLTSLASVNINSNGDLEWGVTTNAEESVVSGGTGSWNTSPVNYIQSIVTNGDHVPKFSNGLSVYDAAAAGVQPTELFYDASIYPFSVNSTLAEQLGGLGVRIDGLTSFINPCTVSTITGIIC
jgi:hypothetical protein